VIRDLPLVLIDACVLVNFPLADTLLRLAEPTQLFEPKWSEEIIRETTRALECKLGWPKSLIAHLEFELQAHFSEAWVRDYEPLISRMANDEKDRHVAAAAVHCGASVIITMNLRHFRTEHLMPWGIVALHPQAFLIELFCRLPESVLAKLKLQAADRNRNLGQLLDILKTTVPSFVALIRHRQ
jgi:hypothetical protein